MSEKIEITDRWCLTEDRKRVVPEGDPEARWLHWIPGDEVPLEEAQRLGAVKAAKPAANKMRKPPRNK